jgi:hypothetical protein
VRHDGKRSAWRHSTTQPCAPTIDLWGSFLPWLLGLVFEWDVSLWFGVNLFNTSKIHLKPKTFELQISAIIVHITSSYIKLFHFIIHPSNHEKISAHQKNTMVYFDSSASTTYFNYILKQASTTTFSCIFTCSFSVRVCVNACVCACAHRINHIPQPVRD